MFDLNGQLEQTLTFILSLRQYRLLITSVINTSVRYNENMSVMLTMMLRFASPGKIQNIKGYN